MPQAKQTDDEVFRELTMMLTPEDDRELERRIERQARAARRRRSVEAIELTEDDNKILEKVWDRERKRMERLNES